MYGEVVRLEPLIRVGRDNNGVNRVVLWLFCVCGCDSIQH